MKNNFRLQSGIDTVSTILMMIAEHNLKSPPFRLLLSFSNIILQPRELERLCAWRWQKGRNEGTLFGSWFFLFEQKHISRKATKFCVDKC